MDSRERQKIYAQTYIPSIGKFEDHTGPIQLASKAKDCDPPTVTAEINNEDGKNMSASNKDSSLLLDAKNTPSCHRAEKCGISDDIEPRKIDVTSEHSGEKKIISDGPPKRNSSNDSSLSESVLGYIRRSYSHNQPDDSGNKQTIQFSAHTWTPESTDVEPFQENLNVRNMKWKDVSDSIRISPSTTKLNEERSSSSTSFDESKKDVKCTEHETMYSGHFEANSRRTALKRRGKQKLPVGIAIARQRLESTPMKSQHAPSRNLPAGFHDKRYHEYTLNQEREVLLRENKELSNYTSTLEKGTGAPLINRQNLVFPEWSQQEKAHLMTSSLLQWQAQQNSLLTSGIHHQPFWLSSTTPPLHLPGSHTYPAMPSLPGTFPAAGYPVIGGGFPGGFVLMPRYLGERVHESMWSPVAMYGNTLPTPGNSSCSYQGISLQDHMRTMNDFQQSSMESEFVEQLRDEGHMASNSTLSACPNKSWICDLNKSPNLWPRNNSRNKSPCKVEKATNLHSTIPSSETVPGQRKIHPSKDDRVECEVETLSSVPVLNIDQTAVHSASGSSIHTHASYTKIDKTCTRTVNNMHRSSEENLDKKNSDERKVALLQYVDTPTQTINETEHNLPTLHNGVEILTKAATLHLKGENSDPLNTLSHQAYRLKCDRDQTPYLPPKPSLPKEESKHPDSDKHIKQASHKRDFCENDNKKTDLSKLEPDVLDAVRGITLLSQAFHKNLSWRLSDCGVQDMVEQDSIPESKILETPAVIENIDFMSNSCPNQTQPSLPSSCVQVKEQDSCDRVRLKRKLHKAVCLKQKLNSDDATDSLETGIKMDNMEAMEIEMKMRLADLQRRYREKQKELAKLQKKAKMEKLVPISESAISSVQENIKKNQSSMSLTPTIHPGQLHYGDSNAVVAVQKSKIPPRSNPPEANASVPKSDCKNKDSQKNRKCKIKGRELKHHSEDHNDSVGSVADSFFVESHPSGSRKRKCDKPKRIQTSYSEWPRLPLVEPAKKKAVNLINQDEKNNNSSNADEGGNNRKLNNKKMDESPTSTAMIESQSPAKDTTISSDNTNIGEKSSVTERSCAPEVDDAKQHPPIENEQSDGDKDLYDRLRLREEDLVKGLQVLIPLEDKLLYIGQINPIQPPDIYEVMVEGHRHRPIVMCLEQILSEAIPEVKPSSKCDLQECSRVAAYWSYKMQCLYTGNIAADDSDSDEEEYDESLVQIEFDDGDSSMIPLENIRLLPKDYPLLQPDAPFMMNFTHKRRTTSELSTKEKSISTGTSRTKSSTRPEKRSSKSAVPRPKKRTKSMKYKSGESDTEYGKENFSSGYGGSYKKLQSRQAETSSSSSIEEESDVVFSDSDDDTYEDENNEGSLKSRLPQYVETMQGSPTNELWSWCDVDVQKKIAKGKAKKITHKSISRGKEVISCGDCAVFLSTGRPYLPYIGRIESMWESWGNNMVVKVRWFYHPEETKGGRLKSHGKHPLYKSFHIDENDVQTISHKCEVVSLKEYTRRIRNRERNVYYCTGVYDPATGKVLQEYSDRRKNQKL